MLEEGLGRNGLSEFMAASALLQFIESSARDRHINEFRMLRVFLRTIHSLLDPLL